MASRGSKLPPSGNYTPPDNIPDDGLQQKPFFIKTKITEMMAYGLNRCDNFPRKRRQLADEIRRIMNELLFLSIRLEKMYYKKATLQDMDIALEALRMYIVIASEPEYGVNGAPPLSIHQREVWSRYTTEIGKMIGGYVKFVNSRDEKK